MKLLQHFRATPAKLPRRALQPHQVILYLTGCLLFSLGVKLFVDSNLGTDPLNAMVIGIVAVIDRPFIRIGLVSSILTIGFLAVWVYWNRRAPPLTTFLTMALVGYLIDLWNAIGLERLTRALAGPQALLVIGLMFDAYASALIIMSGIGIRIMDLLAITITRRWRWPFFAAKMIFELGFVLVAWRLHGPIGVGTIAFVCIVGNFIQIFMWANRALLNLPNYALDAASQSGQ